MGDQTSCRRCGGEMTEGVTLDKGEMNSPSQPVWLEGEFKHSFWTGLETTGRRAFLVRTLRCEDCGCLESYADVPAEL